jgi:alpha-glucosidase
MKLFIFTWVWVIFCVQIACAADYKLQSPDGRLEANIAVGDAVSCTIQYGSRPIVTAPAISMTLEDGRALGQSAKVVKEQRREIDEILKPVLPAKQAEVRNHCRELTLSFEGDYDLVFRAYDDGAAWRFVTRLGGTARVKEEQFLLSFPSDFPIVAAISKQAMEGDFISPNESNFTRKPLSEFKKGELAYPPFIVEANDGVKIAITEADLEDYAGLWLTGSQEKPGQIVGIFPRVIKSIKNQGLAGQEIQRADYIAEVKGTRSFPWRVLAVAKDDAGLIETEIVYCLGPEPAVKDTSWIKPGQVAWDWFNANNIWGVDFESGINTATYRYYIDFAGRHGIPYVIFDEGWSDNKDLLKLNPDMDTPGLIQYAKEKGVGVILWCVWTTVDRQLEEALAQFEKWGVKGIKVDFMNRDDQAVVQYYAKVAEATAKHHLLLNFHGAHKGTGLQRQYPNLVTREGVLGLEHNKWSSDCTPEHCVTLPFVRMLAAPMDFTSGAMSNAQKKDFRDIFERPMSQGTRCMQLAMYVVYESPLQMLCDTPTAYENNACCLDFIVKVPTTWDQTRVLTAKIGQYVLLARQKGNQWFVGAMTNWDKRELTIDFSFLGPGEYEAAFCEDGVNAHRMAIDHNHKTVTVNATTKMPIKLAPGGGWAAIVTPKK